MTLSTTAEDPDCDCHLCGSQPDFTILPGMNVGIDFTGGRNYIVRFDQPVRTGDVQDALTPYFGESVRVITIGSSNQVRISTNHMIDVEGDNVEQELRNLLGEGLGVYHTGTGD